MTPQILLSLLLIPLFPMKKKTRKYSGYRFIKVKIGENKKKWRLLLFLHFFLFPLQKEKIASFFNFISFSRFFKFYEICEKFFPIKFMLTKISVLYVPINSLSTSFLLKIRLIRPMLKNPTES